MIPYFVFQQVNHALFTSIGITVVILLIFGYAKARLVTNRQLACIKSALQTLTMGAIAAGASYGIVTAVNSKLN